MMEGIKEQLAENVIMQEFLLGKKQTQSAKENYPVKENNKENVKDDIKAEDAPVKLWLRKLWLNILTQSKPKRKKNHDNKIGTMEIQA